MGPFRRLLEQFGYVSLKHYGYLLNREGLIVADPVSPRWGGSSQDWGFQPTGLSPERLLTRPPTLQEILPPSLPKPASPRIAAEVETSATEHHIAAAPLTPHQVKPVEETVESEDDEWEWRMAMAQAEEGGKSSAEISPPAQWPAASLSHMPASNDANQTELSEEEEWAQAMERAAKNANASSEIAAPVKAIHGPMHSAPSHAAKSMRIDNPAAVQRRPHGNGASPLSLVVNRPLAKPAVKPLPSLRHRTLTGVHAAPAPVAAAEEHPAIDDNESFDSTEIQSGCIDVPDMQLASAPRAATASG